MAISTKKGWGGMRKNSGPKPTDDPSKLRTKRVRFLVTEAELKALKRAAGDEQLSNFIREILFRAIKRRKK